MSAEFDLADCSGRVLVGADFTGASCRGCDFSGSDLSHVNFTGADLYEADFSNTILYAAEFGGANLTRANFRGAIPYGFLFSSSANVTYAKLAEFKLEKRRRSGVRQPGNEVYLGRSFNEACPDVEHLCEQDYRVGRRFYSFKELSDREAELQRARIFNILKRLYRDNHDGRAALDCHFNERCHLTRSRYSRTILTVHDGSSHTPLGLTRIIFSYLAEFATGYGVRPRRTALSLALLFIAFLLAAWGFAIGSTSSGVMYAGAADRRLGGSGEDALRLVQYVAISLVSPESNLFSPFGWMVPLSLLCFALSACLLAVLFSSLFVMMMNE